MAQCYGPKLLPSPCPLPKLWLHSSGPSSLGLLLQASSRARAHATSALLGAGFAPERLCPSQTSGVQGVGSTSSSPGCRQASSEPVEGAGCDFGAAQGASIFLAMKTNSLKPLAVLEISAQRDTVLTTGAVGVWVL